MVTVDIQILSRGDDYLIVDLTLTYPPVIKDLGRDENDDQILLKGIYSNFKVRGAYRNDGTFYPFSLSLPDSIKDSFVRSLDPLYDAFTNATRTQ